MAITSIIGGQWGDEGKGKIVDILSENVDIVARFQGGANAGHTVIIEGNKIVLHQIPSGILHPECKCILGNGMVVDPVGLFEEIRMVEDQGIETANRILLSLTTHIVTPIHKAIDKTSEDATNQKIGTTCKGIGPAYMDKITRRGIRAHDLLDLPSLKQTIDHRLSEAIKNNEVSKSAVNQINADLKQFYECVPAIAELVSDTFQYLHSIIHQGKNVIIEGAQGTLLDIDHGTYPFVTSSSPNNGGITTGLGIPQSHLDRKIGIFKAYTTRVGKGPFPTELFDGDGDKLGKLGHEFGATTGRPRRCGWFDGVAARYSCLVNGFTEIALTKLDILDNFDEIKVCTAYELDGKLIKNFSEVIYKLDQVTPIYESLTGWSNPVENIDHIDNLSNRAGQYIHFLEELVDTPIKLVSSGPERHQIFTREIS